MLIRCFSIFCDKCIYYSRKSDILSFDQFTIENQGFNKMCLDFVLKDRKIEADRIPIVGNFSHIYFYHVF